MSGQITEEKLTDRVDPARANAWLACLGIEGSVGVGDALPAFAHHAFFWSPVPERDLAHDGHSKPGGTLPDTGLPLRMFGGGRLRLHAPFRSGVAAERSARVTGLTRKEGRSGKLALVTVRHDIRQRGQLVLTEDQDIIYRESGSIETEPPVVTESPDERRALKLSEITLFRYSALTFNAHRIHYDLAYCQREGYPGLLVHGPLMATLLAQMAAERGPVDSFGYRATAPLYLGDVAWLCRTGERFWIEGPRRRLCMTAGVSLQTAR